MLKRLSSEQNRRLSVLAAELISDHDDAVRARSRLGGIAAGAMTAAGAYLLMKRL